MLVMMVMVMMVMMVMMTMMVMVMVMMVMVMIHMMMMEIIPTTSHASDQYLAHRVSSHTKGGRIQPDTTRSSITPRMAPILGGDHRKQFFPIFGRFSIVILGVQVFLCKTHPYGRLEAC